MKANARTAARTATKANPVRQHPALHNARPLPPTFQISLNNDSAGTLVYSVLDALDAVSPADATGNDSDITTTYKGGIADLREYVRTHPVLVKAMQLEVSAASVFTNAFDIAVGDINGDVQRRSIASDIQAAKAAINQNDKILTVPFEVLIDGGFDMIITLGATETMTITFHIDHIFRLR